MPMYRIHGTDIPWGVGMQVSHGCVRLYPEDIERLFPQVPIGTQGVFAYETVKVGRRGNAVYVESHEDIYGKTPATFREAIDAARPTRLVERGRPGEARGRPAGLRRRAVRGLGQRRGPDDDIECVPCGSCEYGPLPSARWLI